MEKTKTTATNQSRAGLPRKRALVINCFFDDTRRPIKRTTKLPQAMGPVYLAGAFAREACDVRLYDEVSSGPLEDEHLLSWPDMLVLTGLTNSFDRMLQLTAYAKTKNVRVIVVAGGPSIRQLPCLAARFFDYACSGDIEELADVIREAFGPAYVAREMLPRFDLAHWITGVGHVESTRYCNFRCGFCSLTGEGRDYRAYGIDYLRKQLMMVGHKRHLLFVDNNFYGSDRRNFDARLELLEELRDAGRLHDWGAMVTNDFFLREGNLARARAAGCELLFSGVESFDANWLRSFNKLQNVGHPTLDVITRCLEAGIFFCYGLILDPASRPIADLYRELDFITATPEITLPSFFSLPIPILGTPYFFDTVRRHAFLPSTKLRDMDGLTIVTKPLDPLPEVVGFLRSLEDMRRYRSRMLRHTVGFVRRYRGTLNRIQLAFAVANLAMTCSRDLACSFSGAAWRVRHKQPRTYVSTTEPPDDQYTPKFHVEARFARHFRPTMVTDERGELAVDMLGSGLFNRGQVAPRQEQ